MIQKHIVFLIIYNKWYKKNIVLLIGYPISKIIYNKWYKKYIVFLIINDTKIFSRYHINLIYVIFCLSDILLVILKIEVSY